MLLRYRLIFLASLQRYISKSVRKQNILDKKSRKIRATSLRATAISKNIRDIYSVNVINGENDSNNNSDIEAEKNANFKQVGI